ncbi:putative beta-glucosidase [Hortaea werneckii]|nr:putative beta-glucosidase [Hortaea werneckii]
MLHKRLLGTATLLSALGTANAQNDSAVGSGPNAAGPTWNHDDFTTSPPVYPSPNATGIGWEEAFQQASDFVNQLTLEEKAYLVTGTPGPCVGNIAPIPRLGFQGLCLQDGPLAIRQANYASVFPAGITVAASWDRKLAKQRGIEMGSEFRGKGAEIALGPVAGPLGRSGYGGRNWEGFSPDPYLTGILFADTIEGMQSAGVQACAKHYIGNEQETQRNPSVNDQGTTIEAVSSNIDDRTMHELYLWPFQDGVKAGVASFMCSYNRINGSYGCQNSKTLNGILKDELGFQGYVMSDWMATHSGAPAIEAGLDMDMPGGLQFTEASSEHSFFGGNITAAVNNGSLSIDRVDDMCRRVMTPYFYLGQSNYPPIDGSEYAENFWSEDDAVYDFELGPSNVDVRDDHAKLIRELGAAGTVLLKNNNNALPLQTPKNIGVFGNDAGDLLDGLYTGALSLGSQGYEYGVLTAGGGSGTGRLSYVVPPLDAIKTRAAQQGNDALVQYVLNNSLITNSGGYSSIFPAPPDVCLVFLKTWAAEGADRESLLVDWNGTAVVETIAASCPNTVVVTNSGGINILPFADHPNVTAILAAHYPGQEAGNSIVDILWGDVNPSGKLPYTITYEESDYAFADITNSTELQNTNDPNAWQSDFEERLLIDYRHFDYFNESVQYEFGFGLSYTSFSMGDVSVQRVGGGALTASPPSNSIVPGGNPALWDVLYSVSATISNTGDVAGATVPQLYLGLPQPSNEDVSPIKALRGFEKVMLAPGESQTVSFELNRRDISYWDIYTQQWMIGSGDINVFAGFSSRDILATSSFSPLSGSGSDSSNSTQTYGGWDSGKDHGDHKGSWHWASNEGKHPHAPPPSKTV